MPKGMITSLYYSPSDVDLEKGACSQDSASSVALPPPDPDVDMGSVQCPTPGRLSRGQELPNNSTPTASTNPFLRTGPTQTRLQSLSRRKAIATPFPSSLNPASGWRQPTMSTSQSAKIPETQGMVSWSKRERSHPVTLSESSNQKRTHDALGEEEDPDVHVEYEDNVGYGVRSKVRVRVREPANVERLETNFGEMANELQTALRERASLQQRVDDISKQLDKSIQAHEAMKTELEGVIQRAKRELEESETQSRKELNEVLQRIGEENDVALGLARQETGEHVEQLMLEQEELIQRLRGDLQSSVEERIEVEQARDAAIRDALASQSHVHQEAMHACAAEVEEKMNGRIKELAGLVQQETGERVEQLMLEQEELIQRLRGELQSAVEERIEVEQAQDAAIRDALASQSGVHAEAMHACAAEFEEKMNRRIEELAGMHEQAMHERVAQGKVELERRIKDIQENHKKQLNELYKSNEQSTMQEHRDKHPPLEEVLAQHRPILRKEILTELGVESEAALREASERYLHQIAEAEQAGQELQKRIEDGEKRLEIEVQNVKRLELQLSCIENDQPPANPDSISGNVDQMDIDVGPSQKALGKRTARSEMDGRVRLEVIHTETPSYRMRGPEVECLENNRAYTNLGPNVAVSGLDGDVDQMDADRRRRPYRPETVTCARLKAISKRNIRFHTGTPISETIRQPERFRKPIGCASTIANRLRIQTPPPRSLTPTSSLRNQHLQGGTPNLRGGTGNYGFARSPGPSTICRRESSPFLAPPGILGSAHDSGPSTISCRDTSPLLNPPGVYSSARAPGPSTTYCRDRSSLVNSPDDYNTSETQPTAPTGSAAPTGSISSQPCDTNPTSLTGMFQAFRGEMQDMRNVLDKLVQSRESSTSPSPQGYKHGTYKHGTYKLNRSQRPRTNARNNLMKVVRDEMDQLLGIKKDAEIIDSAKTGTFAELDEAERFDEGTIDAPPLEPLRVCWDSIKSLWNFHLADIFANHMVRLKPEYVTEEDHEEIANHFMKRLESLRRELTKHLPQNDESDNEVKVRYENRKLKTLHRKRIQRRQAGLYSTRLEICKTGSAGGHNPAWDILALMVGKLGIDGNSSDETDAELDRSYAIRFREWRSSKVKGLLQFIDDNRNITNAYGNNKPGTLPHKRVRKTYPPVTQDNPIAHLPLNFYDKTWYDSLSLLQQTQLDPIPEMELPIIDD